jgi:hypothetical protein
LLLRGNTDFDSLDAYRDWIADLIGRRNARREKLVALERAELSRLPPRRTTDHDEASVRVTSSSGFILRKVFYTVLSRRAWLGEIEGDSAALLRTAPDGLLRVWAVD